MNLRIPRLGAAALLIFMLAGAALFVFFMDRFGGPSIRFSEPYSVTVTLDDTLGLAPGSQVIVRGVVVGDVDSVERTGDGARLRLELADEYAPLPGATTISVAQKTLFGEPYVELDPNGRRDAGAGAGGEISSGGEIPPAAVRAEALEVDQALDVLDAPARADLNATLAELSRGIGGGDASAGASATLAELDRATAELRRLELALAGQEDVIASAVTDARGVVGELAERRDDITAIVADGERALSAAASRATDLDAGLRELQPLLVSARATLAEVRPLLIEARPLAADLTAAAPDLRAALAELPAVSADAERVLAAAPALERDGVPFLAAAAGTLGLAGGAGDPLADAMRNGQPIGRYLSDRRHAFAAWFSNTGDLGSHRDDKGYFARFFVGFDPNTATGAPGGRYDTNAYTGPRDAESPQPYSGYPRLEPFDPYGSEADPNEEDR
ncbi:MCE family protein [Thermoleophilia bacterium SCSIO 60948]|nr:MCE family protein [Thermoleophilia bacterium SCSIO 60948]